MSSVSGLEILSNVGAPPSPPSPPSPPPPQDSLIPRVMLDQPAPREMSGQLDNLGLTATPLYLQLFLNPLNLWFTQLRPLFHPIPFLNYPPPTITSPHHILHFLPPNLQRLLPTSTPPLPCRTPPLHALLQL